MKKSCPVLTIGPTVPSKYLDNWVKNDNDYGLNLFTLESSISIINRLDTKPIGFVIYVSFGGMANLSNMQIEEPTLALKGSKCYFLLVVKACW